MGLFDKKYCDVCGEKIGLLGNRKLEDANLCKKCAAKLSPWFSERRHSTLEEIKAQLAYREDNKEEVANFHTTRTFGRYMKLYVDENQKKFLVTREKDLAEANPDVISFSQVTGCELDIDENRRELFRKDKEGKSISYEPRRYEYSYDFYIIIHVNHPYFDEIRFQLNGSSVENGQRSINDAGFQPGSIGAGTGVVGSILNALAGQAASVNPEYQEYVDMGNEIRRILMQEHAPQPVHQKMICPYCNANTVPDANGCCEYCGSTIVKE